MTSAPVASTITEVGVFHRWPLDSSQLRRHMAAIPEYAKTSTFGKAPPVLYHYTRHRGLLGIVGEGKLWASQIQFLNDSLEFEHAWRLLESWLPNDGFGQAFRMFLSRDRQLKHGVCVTSFSERDDDLSQWRAYGDVGNAYSIGFDVAALLKVADLFEGRLLKCVYAAPDQTRELGRVVGPHYEAFIAFYEAVGGNLQPHMADLNEMIDRFMDDFFVLAPTLKSDAFAGEHEYRLVFPPPHKGLTLRFSQGRNFLVPYLEIEWSAIAHKLPIADLVVGPGPHADLAAQAAATLLFERGYFAGQVRISNVPYRG